MSIMRGCYDHKVTSLYISNHGNCLANVAKPLEEHHRKPELSLLRPLTRFTCIIVTGIFYKSGCKLLGIVFLFRKKTLQVSLHVIP